ncbi:MAG: hypothetical protein NC489_29545 [Ruminococcus flavefaciens]|nr:hypothetical protein [Ruminococcus flavefaciens]
MELIKQLKADGIDKGLCRLWQGKLREGLSVEQLAKLYIQGIDFCISENYPTLGFLREHFRGECEPFGVYVDDEIPSAKNLPNMVLNGACRGMLEYDGYSVSCLYVRHDSEVAVIVSDNAILTIDLFDRAKLHISVVGDDTNVSVNCYGPDVEIDYIGETTKAKVTTKYNDKTSY